MDGVDYLSELKYVVEYLKEYIISYKKEFERFTSQPPEGAGYPQISISPYLYSSELHCFIAKDGVIISDFSKQPSDLWYIVGGPALMADYPESRTPIEVTELLKKQGILGKPIGIYRLVSQNGFAEELWNGILPDSKEKIEEKCGNTKIHALKYDISLNDLLQRLTYGVLNYILNIYLPDNSSAFWNPHIIRELGFLTADRKNRRFFNYMEIYTHIEEAAWDKRSTWIRVNADVRRDFRHYFTSIGQKGAYLSFAQKPEVILEMFHDRLLNLGNTIKKFETLLEQRETENEQVFHDFLKENPILLDVYGEPISKPKFYYPDSDSPLGKKYVEPDFIIKYPGNKYKLVELERPSKMMATNQGQPRCEVTQSAFQIAEWKHYIFNHYELIKDKFPGISVPTNCLSMVVISRETKVNFGKYNNPADFMELVNLQNSCEILVYDDLLKKAKQAYDRLCSLK